MEITKINLIWRVPTIASILPILVKNYSLWAMNGDIFVNGMNILQFPIHQSFYQMMKTLSTFYKENDAFWKYDYQAYEKGFNWVKIDGDSNLFAFSRMSDDQEILTIHNFNDQELFDVHLDLPAESEYKLVFSSSTIPMETFSI